MMTILQGATGGSSPRASKMGAVSHMERFMAVLPVVVVALLIVIPNQLFGSAWYQTFGLGFGNVVGVPTLPDRSDPQIWTTSIA